MSPNSSQKQNPIAAILAVAAMVAGGWLLLGRSSGIPDVMKVTHPPDRDPKLVRMIDDQVRVVERHPGDARARAVLGAMFEANGLWREARDCYLDAAKLNPKEPMWVHHAAIAWQQLDDPDGYLAALREYAARFPYFAPLCDRLGAALLEIGEFSQADEAFRRVTELAPDFPHGYVGRGDAQLRMGNPKQALGFLEPVVQQHPEFKMARYLLGRIYRDLGRLAEAEREMRLGVGAKPQPLEDAWTAEQSKYTLRVDNQKLYAASLIAKGKPEQGAAILERIVQANPSDVEAVLNLGIAYMHSNRLEDSLVTLQRARTLDASRFEVFVNLAACCRRMGGFDEALDYATQAVALAPEMAAAHHAKGAALMALQRNQEALEAFQSAADLDPQSTVVRQDLANVLVRLKKYEAAVEQYQTLSKMLPNRWEPQLGLAKVSFLIGRFEDARKHVTLGLKMAPGEPRLQAIAADLSKLNGGQP